VNDLTGMTPSSRDHERAVASTVAAITAVVESARAIGAHVILTTIFPLAHGSFADHAVQAAISVVNTALLALAGEGVQVFDSAAVLARADGYVRPVFADDELHLSLAGYTALNEALAPLLNAPTRKAPE
jgi:nicotinamidase-related amidase